MKLTDLLIRDACVMDMQARTKKDALRELADALAGHAVEVAGDELLEKLLGREKLGTTALGDGIAIPHARIDSLERVLVSFGRSRGGLDFESVDGEPTRMFFMLVAPDREGSTHLLTLARLSRFLSMPDFRAKLLEAESVDDLFRALEEQESRL